MEISQIEELLKPWAHNLSAEMMDFNSPVELSGDSRSIETSKQSSSANHSVQRLSRSLREAAIAKKAEAVDRQSSDPQKTTSGKQNASSDGASLRVGHWIVHFRLAALNAEGISAYSYAIPFGATIRTVLTVNCVQLNLIKY